MNVGMIRCYPSYEIRAAKAKEEAREIYELNDVPKRHLYSLHKVSRMILIKNEITTTIAMWNRRSRRQRIEQNPINTEWSSNHIPIRKYAPIISRFRIKFSWMINSIVFYRRFVFGAIRLLFVSWPVSYYIYIHEKRADSEVLIIKSSARGRSF